jgi:hypothetical protein
MQCTIRRDFHGTNLRCNSIDKTATSDRFVKSISTSSVVKYTSKCY